MPRRCARCWQKTSDAQFEENCRGLGDEGEGLFAAPCLRSGGDGPEGLPLPVQPSGRRRAAARLRELASQRRRFGYRRLHILLEREGVRGQLEEAVPALPGGAAHRAQARRPQAGARHPRADGHPAGSRTSAGASTSCPTAWPDGRRFRVLCVIDDFSRECLAAVVDTSISGQRVARELDRIAEREAIPAWWSATTSYVGNELPLEASDHGASERPDAC